MSETNYYKVFLKNEYDMSEINYYKFFYHER
jgi:hypothetical protein